MPSYLSPEAVTLLRKMLVVNPVNRVTVAEIRQDPWFKHNLPDYLRPAEAEFVDTGVDPRQHPNRSREVKAAKAAGDLHEAVVGKLKKTLGYGNEDVHEALGKEEPNAIKDAYNIVRENQMMMRDCKFFIMGHPPSPPLPCVIIRVHVLIYTTVWDSPSIKRAKYPIVSCAISASVEFSSS